VVLQHGKKCTFLSQTQIKAITYLIIVGVDLVQDKRYWIVGASRDHVMRAVQGGFAQLCHGKEAPLKKMNTGDWIIYYSPKMNFKESTPHQKFTALGKVVDNNIF
jgi:hypothetical protein